MGQGPHGVAGRRLVILDRDGTINVERHYLGDPADVELLPKAAAGIRLLKDAGFAVVVATNQSGVARGYFSMENVNEIHETLQRGLRQHGTEVDAFYVCSHAPADDCDCRKPRPGLVLLAARDFSADLRESFVVGDKTCDVELARAVGAVPVLVLTGYGASTLASGAQCDTAPDLTAAAQLIIQQSGSRNSDTSAS